MPEDGSKFKSSCKQGMAGKSFRGPKPRTPIGFQIKRAQLTNQTVLLAPSCDVCRLSQALHKSPFGLISLDAAGGKQCGGRGI